MFFIAILELFVLFFKRGKNPSFTKSNFLGAGGEIMPENYGKKIQAVPKTKLYKKTSCTSNA